MGRKRERYSKLIETLRNQYARSQVFAWSRHDTGWVTCKSLKACGGNTYTKICGIFMYQLRLYLCMLFKILCQTLRSYSATKLPRRV
jgi:hypothetical protein